MWRGRGRGFLWLWLRGGVEVACSCGGEGREREVDHIKAIGNNSDCGLCQCKSVLFV